MDLVTQAYMAMHPSPAKEAANILNSGKPAKFRGGVHNRYEVPHSADSLGNSMASMVDSLESSGFEHISHSDNKNSFKHLASGKVINIETEENSVGQYTHNISRK